MKINNFLKLLAKPLMNEHGWITAVIAAVGVVSSLLASDSSEDAADDAADAREAAGYANAQISKYDSDVAEKDAKTIYDQTVAKYKLHQNTVEKIMGAQRARYGKSGVAISEGTPLTVIAKTSHDAFLDGQTILRDGQKAYRRKKSHAQRYRMLAASGMRDAAAQAANIRDAGSDQALIYNIQALQYGMQATYDIGTEMDWWSSSDSGSD